MSDSTVVMLVFLGSAGISWVIGILCFVLTLMGLKNSRGKKLLPCAVAAAVGPIAMLCYSLSFPLEEPTSVAGIAGAFAGYAVTLFFVYRTCGKKGEEKSRNLAERDFYNKCKKYGITSRKSVENSAKNQERLKMLAEREHIPFSRVEDLYAILDKAAEFEALNQKETETAQQRELKREQNRLRPWEQKEQEMLTRYARFHGREKPLAMLKDQEKRWRDIENRPGSMPLKKESDGAIMAGIAAGIGGTVPAVMSLAQTAKNNESIREYNQAAMAYNAVMGGRSNKTSMQYARLREAMADKLVAELPGEELMKHLSFANTKVVVTATGTVWVGTRVDFDDKLIIFDEVPAFIDGTVRAEIYDGTQKIGTATMVFPLAGSCKITRGGNNPMKRGSFPGTGEDAAYAKDWPSDWKYLAGSDNLNVAISCRKLKAENFEKETWLAGMCLFCGEPDKNYTVKFVPGDLWAMEK